MIQKPKKDKVLRLKSNSSLKEVVAYLKANPLLLTSEKNNYSAEKLMMLLDNEKLAALEDEFNEHQNGIELPNFIWLMKNAITHPEEDKYDLVNGLIKLFQDIDINGDRHMEWSEFTQYIIDAVIGEKDTKFFDVRFEKDREFTENEILDKAYSRKTKRYVQSKLFDNTLHSSTIKKMVYCPNTDLVLALEQNSKKLKFYTPECVVKDILSLPLDDKLQKAFVLDFCFAESQNIIACISSDRQLFFWENGFNHRILKTIKTDVLQTGIWYLEQHSKWLTAGADNTLRMWIWSTHEEKFDEINFITPLGQEHVKQITEIIEITVPKMIASCSLDGKIKLWEIAERTFLSDLKDPSPHSRHSRGIRGATYSYEYGGNLLTFGFENHINVWCPEISKTRSFIGKLEGHSSIIVACKFIPYSPNVISIDDKTNIRIWDIRTLSTIQVLASEQGAALVADVAVITKHDKFVLGGKRLIFYDNSAVSKSIKNFNEDIYAVQIDYNVYYNCFSVLTKIDLRVYDALTGKLKKVFNDLHDEKIIVDLTTFCYGANERKFYIADNGGFMRVYNMKNGEFMKKVNLTTEIEGAEFANKHAHIKKKENNEVSALIYLREERLLITASWDSTIRIYDESEPEESILLRVFSGGHQESEILTLAYSSHLSLLASGSSNGFIAIWDLESGKLETLLIGSKSDINALEFADPYPLLFSASNDGFICVWGVRPIPQKFKYICLLQIVNCIWERSEEKYLSVTGLACQTDVGLGIPRSKTITKYFPNSSQFETLDDVSARRASFSSVKKKKAKKTTLTKEDESMGSEVFGEFNESQEDWEQYFKQDELDLPLTKRRCYILCGDLKGNLFLLNLTEFLRKRGITECEKYKKAQTYQLRRKDLINATKQVEMILQNEFQQNEKNPKKREIPRVYACNTVMYNKWEAHTSQVNKITKIKDPLSFTTCSLDKHVKIWSLEGELLGDINLVKLGNNFWKFPFDWVKNKLSEIDDVFDSLEKIEKERLSETQKNEIKTNFLVNKYLSDCPDFLNQKREEGTAAPFQTEKEKIMSEVLSSNKSPVISKSNMNASFGATLFQDRVSEEKVKKKPVNEPENMEREAEKEKKAPEPPIEVKKNKYNQVLFEKLSMIDDRNNRELKRKTSKTNVPEESKKSATPFIQSSLQSKVLDKSGFLIPKSTTTVPKIAGSSKVKENTAVGKDGPFAQTFSNFRDLKKRKPDFQKAKERELFLYFSANSFFKNNHYVNNLVSGRMMSSQRNIPPLDIRLREGECLRTLKLATIAQFDKFESESQNILCCDNNELLRKKKKFYKELQSSGKMIWEQYKEKEGENPNDSMRKRKSARAETEEKDKKSIKVIASRTFLHNPHLNKHKILKTKGKLYVLNNQ